MTVREQLIETFVHIPPRHALDGLSTADAERVVPGVTHSIAEIVAHLAFWQAWFCSRCEGVDEPMVAKAAAGWPAVLPGTFPEVRERFLAGLERAVALGDRATTPITPAIEFPPLARYTIGDALGHMAQHNSHHLGEIIVLRQLMSCWPPPAGSWTW